MRPAGRSQVAGKTDHEGDYTRQAHRHRALIRVQRRKPPRLSVCTTLVNFGGSDTSRFVSMSEMTPIGMLIKKTQRQEKLSVIHPPSGGPIAGALTIAMVVSTECGSALGDWKGVHYDRLFHRC